MTDTTDTTKTDTQTIEGPAVNSDHLGHNHAPSDVHDGGIDGRMYAGNDKVDETETDSTSVANQAALSHSGDKPKSKTKHK